MGLSEDDHVKTLKGFQGPLRGSLIHFKDGHAWNIKPAEQIQLSVGNFFMSKNIFLSWDGITERR